MTTFGPPFQEEKQKERILKVSKILFLLGLLYSLWIAIIIMGIYFLKLGNRWAFFATEQWILSAIFLISIAIGLEVVLLLKYMLSQKRQSKPEEQQKHKEYLQGKQVYYYTIPLHSKGGIFSKTYILIDEDRVLNLRYQMIPPNDLWGQQP